MVASYVLKAGLRKARRLEMDTQERAAALEHTFSTAATSLPFVAGPKPITEDEWADAHED